MSRKAKVLIIVAALSLSSINFFGCSDPQSQNCMIEIITWEYDTLGLVGSSLEFEGWSDTGSFVLNDTTYEVLIQDTLKGWSFRIKNVKQVTLIQDEKIGFLLENFKLTYDGH